jgi:type III pantothenate kinase
MVFRMKKELGGVVKTVATGGLAPLMKGVSETIDVVEPNLTLVGLKLIGESMTPSALP